MSRICASLLLSIGISISAAQPCVASELHVQVDAASDVGGQSTADSAAALMPAPEPTVATLTPSIISWRQVGLGTAILLSPATLGLVPVDWALAAELIGQWL